MLYEVSANTENWMIAGRKRGHVSLSAKQGFFNYLTSHICFLQGKYIVVHSSEKWFYLSPCYGIFFKFFKFLPWQVQG